MLEDILFAVFFAACLWLVCMLLNPVMWQSLRNAWYVDKLKKERDKDMGMPKIPDPWEDEDNGKHLKK